MGQLNYLSALQFVDGVVGNSSSGLLEAPTFKIGTINIGDRQKGRLKAKSVFDSGYETKEINSNISKILKQSKEGLINFSDNPYGNGGAADKILNILREINIPKDLEKKFFDL